MDTGLSKDAYKARARAEVDMVNHPPHYTSGKIEVLDFIEDKGFGYLAGQIIKYVSRYRVKNGLEDLKKAEFYLKRLIARGGRDYGQ